MLAVATEQLAISDVTLERVLSTLSDTMLNDILLKGDTIKEFFERAKAEATCRAIHNKTQFTGFKLRNGSERRFFRQRRSSCGYFGTKRRRSVATEKVAYPCKH